MSLYLGNNLISGVTTPVEPTRNIGQIIQSTLPLTDAGLHLLDGALINGSGIYADFVTYIAGLVSTYPDLFETESNWQTAVTTYGVCGKFVYDSVNNTVRLPKITGIVEGASGVANLGDLTEAGLPNITGFHGLSGYGQVGGAFYAVTDLSESISSGASSSNGVRFNASRSSSIYGNSNTVQPQTIKVLYYIVVATSTKTAIQVDIDEIATDLNGKADTDLSNVPTSKGILTESYINGSSWYRVYSDGWCEQGGRFNANNTATTASYTVNLLKSYKDTNYSIVTCGYSNHADQFKNGVAPYSFTTSSFVIQTFNNDALQPIVWQASGYIN